ncbi:hypothetical protein QG37_06907 [Candidozyma auris]|uniref:Uncharacterized protein n=1 Tax=Candidozyma auris TaxID=498019 RepID=A0A0L0NRM2_CANAR|nr:hypothetical protein QG37_06907 [[Candida] auris]
MVRDTWEARKEELPKAEYLEAAAAWVAEARNTEVALWANI